ncbi:MAG: hypothetical protein U1F87_00220 [Kiritimatiellia bacterium]
MKIVDFTCNWALGWRTPDEVFQQIWNGSNFWTPINAGPPPRPDNLSGFKGRGDPIENTRGDAWGAPPMCYTFRHDLNNPYPKPGFPFGSQDGQYVDGFLDLNYARCGGWAKVFCTFVGTHGAAAEEQPMPLMKWRFEESGSGDVTFVDWDEAGVLPGNRKRVNGGDALPGDTWYVPFGIWVAKNGQANPYIIPDWEAPPGISVDGSERLVSFWNSSQLNGGTDHQYVKYNNCYLDPSYSGSGQYATHNELADAAVSHYYYNEKWVFSGRIEHILVESGGDQYSAVPTVAIVGAGGIGSGAIAEAVVQNGKIVDINMLAEGSGYMEPVRVTLEGGTPALEAVVKPVVVNWENKVSDLPVSQIWYGDVIWLPNSPFFPPGSWEAGWKHSAHYLIVPNDYSQNEMMEN